MTKSTGISVQKMWLHLPYIRRFTLLQLFLWASEDEWTSVGLFSLQCAKLQRLLTSIIDVLNFTSYQFQHLMEPRYGNA